MFKFASIVVALLLGAVCAQEVDAHVFGRLRAWRGRCGAQATQQCSGGLFRGGCANGSCAVR